MTKKSNLEIGKNLYFKGNRIKLTPEDEIILENLKRVIKGISIILGKAFEIVLHSFKDLNNSVIAIENGDITGRKIGSPMTDYGLRILEKIDSFKNDVIGSYYTQKKHGQKLKSTTIIIRNGAGNPIGFLCINVDLSAPVGNFMEELITVTEDNSNQEIVEHFPLTERELVKTSLEDVLHRIEMLRGVSPVDKNKKVVLELYKRGIFNIKNGIDIVSKVLGISRYTTYNYIRDIKSLSKES